MADKIFQIATNGQQIQQDDVNLLGETAGLAQDHVFAELLRMTPYDGSTVSKGILPPSGKALITTSGSGDAKIYVNPFRAFIGSRTAEASEALDNLQDIRSCLSVAEGATNDQTQITLAANASGNPRWDLVYAAVAVDADSATVTRKVKDVSTKVVSSTSVVVTKVQTMTIGVVAGTPGATPAFPTIPADAGSTYNIALGYVRVPNGFGASTTVLPRNINEVANVLSIDRATGASTLRPANQNYVTSGAGISGAGTTTLNGPVKWNGTTETRPAVYLPPTMSGGESLLIAVDLSDASSANWSHASGAIIDSSRDWRRRMFKWMVGIGKGSDAQFPWVTAYSENWSTLSTNALGNNVPAPGNATTLAQATYTLGMGHSFGEEDPSLSEPAAAFIQATGGASDTPNAEANVATNIMATSSYVKFYADFATGNLVMDVFGTPAVNLILWLDASAQFDNV